MNLARFLRAGIAGLVFLISSCNVHIKDNKYVFYGNPRHEKADWVWIDRDGRRHFVEKRSLDNGFCYKITVSKDGNETGKYNINCIKIKDCVYSSEWRYSGEAERNGTGFPNELSGIFPGDNYFRKK